MSPEGNREFLTELVEYLAEDIGIDQYESAVKVLSNRHATAYFPTHREIIDAAPKYFYGSKPSGYLGEPRLTEEQIEEVRTALKSISDACAMPQ